MSPRLEITGLTVARGRETLLPATDLTLAAGEIVALADPAGLIARALVNVLPPGLTARWDLRLDGESVYGAAGVAEELRRGRIAFVPANADRALSPHLTLLSMFEEVPWPTGTDDIARRAAIVLSRMGVAHAGDQLERRAADLARPARWRVALALATAADPGILIAEAPARDLDGTVRSAILARLSAWARATGATVLLTGQGDEGIASIADRVVPDVERLPQFDVRPDDVTDEPDDEPMLTVRDLRVAIPVGRSLTGAARWMTVVEGVNFELDRRGSVALVGETGSGKSTLARALVRIARPTRGHVTWRGKNLVTCSHDTMRTLRRDLQILFSNPMEALDPLRRVGAQIEEALTNLCPGMTDGERKAVALDSLRWVGLSPDIARVFPTALTMAEAARAGLARALAVGPQILVCDEPTAKLGEEDGEAFLDTLLSFNRKGLMLIYATAHARIALRIGKRILVLNAGTVVEDAPARVLAEDPRHPLTQALIALARGEVADLEGDGAGGRGGRGCPMRPRCARGKAQCASSPPPLERVGPAHLVACHGSNDGDSDE